MVHEGMGVADADERNREIRLRNKARRQGLFLHRSKRRDPDAIDYGCYWLNRIEDGIPVFGSEDGRPIVTLDQIENFLKRAK